ncbi:MAG TPA: TIGR00159 family protein [Candidatus Pullilachnospira intestinigallinarum]|nr:TIGR00159 family protein [Candidatus Pullilachnospira intestinigallinarum]
MQTIMDYLAAGFSRIRMMLPASFSVIDIVEIFLIAFFVYYMMLWVKNTRAYMLLKGIVFVVLFLLVAELFHMNTILWIFSQLSVVLITGILVIFQPELRSMLEQLGEKKIINTVIPFDSSRDVEERLNDRTIGELIHAAYAMGEVKTGALIVVEQKIILKEYEKTGIPLDSLVSSQLLINIFEHNTPLHDGAVIVRNNRIVAATCYLPLSDNLSLSKSLGTRHRAAVGISEVSDALTIVVSEETGKISYSMGGVIHTGVTPSQLRDALNSIKLKPEQKDDTGKFRLWKGRGKNEEKAGK